MNLDLQQIADHLAARDRSCGAWLLDLTADALKKNPTLDGMEAYVADSGEGRWTVFEAIDLNVSRAGDYRESLIRRLRSA